MKLTILICLSFKYYIQSLSGDLQRIDQRPSGTSFDVIGREFSIKNNMCFVQFQPHPYLCLYFLYECNIPKKTDSYPSTVAVIGIGLCHS